MLALEAKDLCVRFNGQRILEGINCRADAGEFLAIVGPNGAGKTTLLKAILALVKPTSGELLIYGLQPRKVDPKIIGYVPQIKTLDRTFPALAIELVVSGLRHRWPSFIRKKDRARGMELLENVGVAHLAERALNSLSGGELQRVYLACSMVHKPKLIVMDEPATGMDIVAQKTLYQILEDYRKNDGSTVVMVTHDWGIASHHATSVLIVNRDMIAFGAPDEVLTSTNLARAFGHAGHPMTPIIE